MHTCPAVNPGPTPHVGGPISSGSPDVNIGYLPAARVSDTAVCVPATDAISNGARNVFINHKKAARIGDPTRHGGVIVAGCATVNIGDTPQSFALSTAAKGGTPFCEECEKAKRQLEELRAPPPPNEPPIHSLGPPKPPSLPSMTIAELAKSPNKVPDDGHNVTRKQAREKVATDFLATLPNEPTSADIESQLRRIDMTKPVEVVKRPNANKTLTQAGDSAASAAAAPSSPLALKSRAQDTGAVQYMP
ncbi:MAG TPA: hypothetical protein ENK23_00360 [Sorangium sp.]|nr:hypothetical protein [Sorangium sp.]